jgi:hypothetical protein
VRQNAAEGFAEKGILRQAKYKFNTERNEGGTEGTKRKKALKSLQQVGLLWGILYE